MSPIRWDDRARREANSAYRYYLKNGGQSVAEGFATELEAITQEIISHPHVSAKHLRGTRIRTLDNYPYMIVFKIIAKEDLVGVAVAHTSRKPGYWWKRTR